MEDRRCDDATRDVVAAAAAAAASAFRGEARTSTTAAAPFLYGLSAGEEHNCVYGVEEEFPGENDHGNLLFRYLLFLACAFSLI